MSLPGLADLSTCDSNYSWMEREVISEVVRDWSVDNSIFELHCTNVHFSFFVTFIPSLEVVPFFDPAIQE